MIRNTKYMLNSIHSMDVQWWSINMIHQDLLSHFSYRACEQNEHQRIDDVSPDKIYHDIYIQPLETIDFKL